MQTRRPSRMCIDCKTITETPILVRAIEQMSGPGWSLYACPDCAPQRITNEEAMSQLFDHTMACVECTPDECCAQGWALSRVAGRTLRRVPPPPPNSLGS